MIYTKNNLGDFRQKFIDIGITDEDDMVKVLNYLDQLAEIGYEVYRKKLKEEENLE